MAWVSCLRHCLLQQAETKLDAIIRLERFTEQARQKNALLSELFNDFSFFRQWAEKRGARPGAAASNLVMTQNLRADTPPASSPARAAGGLRRFLAP